MRAGPGANEVLSPDAVQEFLDGRALLTPQQRGRLQDFLADAGPDQLESVQESVNINPPPFA